MSAHGLVKVTPHVFDGVIYRERLYPVFARDAENWIDGDGHVIAKRVIAKPSIFLVRAPALERPAGHKSWEED